MSFLPDDYKVPESKGKYFKMKIGDNRFRVLTPAVVGYEGWTEVDGKKKPIRKHIGEAFKITEVDPDTIKHFWAFGVWNPELKRIQVLQLTQKSVMEHLAKLARDEDWGDPKQYDILVTAVGEKLERKYNVITKPKTPLPQEAIEAWDKVKDRFNLDRLFVGGDPFDEEKGKGVVAEPIDEEINIEDIPF